MTISFDSVTPTVPESVRFFPPGRARSFVIVCLSLQLPLMAIFPYIHNTKM